MKYVCCECGKLVDEKKVIRMPFELQIEYYYCEKCYKKWNK